MEKYEFDAVMIKADGIDGAYIEFPYDVEKAFGKAGKIKVKAYFEGLLYRGSLVKMGRPFHIIGITKDIRKSIGKNPGDTVHVVIEHDIEERKADIPADLVIKFDENPKAKDFFDKLSYTHQKEYVTWIESAKKEETRISRVEKTLEMLLEGKKSKQG